MPSNIGIHEKEKFDQKFTRQKKMKKERIEMCAVDEIEEEGAFGDEKRQIQEDISKKMTAMNDLFFELDDSDLEDFNELTEIDGFEDAVEAHDRNNQAPILLPSSPVVPDNTTDCIDQMSSVCDFAATLSEAKDESFVGQFHDGILADCSDPIPHGRDLEPSIILSEVNRQSTASGPIIHSVQQTSDQMLPVFDCGAPAILSDAKHDIASAANTSTPITLEDGFDRKPQLLDENAEPLFIPRSMPILDTSQNESDARIGQSACPSQASGSSNGALSRKASIGPGELMSIIHEHFPGPAYYVSRLIARIFQFAEFRFIFSKTLQENRRVHFPSIKSSMKYCIAVTLTQWKQTIPFSTILYDGSFTGLLLSEIVGKEKLITSGATKEQMRFVRGKYDLAFECIYTHWMSISHVFTHYSPSRFPESFRRRVGDSAIRLMRLGDHISKRIAVLKLKYKR